MKQLAIINIYNFIRMSHQEPSEFIQADFDTIAKQIRVLKQYGLPSTYALKYDALMNPKYQELMRTATDENDEIGAWWEICKPLCDRAGIVFQGKISEVFDERVGSAYSVGYTPEERCKLVDAYMADFYCVFGYYPKTLGSWILDSVTVSYAREKYGVIGFAICRDQIGTDGFTLWGGWPNGLYVPSKNNVYVPSQTKEGSIPATMFRLLGPDPILCFEQDVREGTSGVYTLEPCSYNGRDTERISWFFSTLTENEGAGIGYAQVGQENNFLWENIRPGFEPQLKIVKELFEQGKVRLETMAESAAWFGRKYALTPSLCWQASVELTHELCVGSEGVMLDTQWYASRFYRVGFLAEQGHLRIRDWFLFREKYPCRYLHERIRTAASTFDALPLVYAQKWGSAKERPFVRFMENDGGNLKELEGECCFFPVNGNVACAQLKTSRNTYVFTMREDSLQLKSDGENFVMQFDKLPVYTKTCENVIYLTYEGFVYDFVVKKGRVLETDDGELKIRSEKGEICLYLAGSIEAGSVESENAETEIFTEEYLAHPQELDEWIPRWIKNPLPLERQCLRVPVFSVPDRCFDIAKGGQKIIISALENDSNICYSFSDRGSKWDNTIHKTICEWIQSDTRCAEILLTDDAKIQAYVNTKDGRVSDTETASYRFAWKDVKLSSNTTFDWRPVFDGRGIDGLLKEERGDGDWQCGRWIGTLENLDFVCELPEERFISLVEVGFLTNHRAGIIYPEALELYVGADREHLQLFDVLRLPEGPAKAEIECQDFGFRPNVRAKCIRFVAKRYDIMPQWCCYRGTTGIFTMADCLIIR